MKKKILGITMLVIALLASTGVLAHVSETHSVQGLEYVWHVLLEHGILWFSFPVAAVFIWLARRKFGVQDSEQELE